MCCAWRRMLRLAADHRTLALEADHAAILHDVECGDDRREWIA
jgi:hypothetical protein